MNEIDTWCQNVGEISYSCGYSFQDIEDDELDVFRNVIANLQLNYRVIVPNTKIFVSTVEIWRILRMFAMQNSIQDVKPVI